MTWAPDGRRLFASAGGNNKIRTYGLRAGPLREGAPIVLAERFARSYPMGLAVTPDGRSLLVAQNLLGRVAAIDLATGQRKGEAPVGSLPYAGALTASGEKVCVSNWGERSLTVLRASDLSALGTVPVGLHPGALAVDPVRPRLYAGSTLRTPCSAPKGAMALSTKPRTRFGRHEDPPSRRDRPRSDLPARFLAQPRAINAVKLTRPARRKSA